MVLQRFVFEVLHGDECTAVVIAYVVNGADVRMIQAGSGLRLAAEAAEQMLIGGDVIGKKFESNETAETGVLGLINHSHSAAAELFDHLVMRDGLANHARVGNPWRQS